MKEKNKVKTEKKKKIKGKKHKEKKERLIKDTTNILTRKKRNKKQTRRR